MAKVVAAEYRLRYEFYVLVYLVFLIITWVFTCFLARSPFSLTKLWTRPEWDVTENGIQKADADHATRLSYVLEVFSYLTAVIALPVVYAILARAAVVYTLRTGKSKQLSLVQLFQVADRNFIWGLHKQSRFTRPTSFSNLATLLIFITAVHTIIRLATVDSTWSRAPLADTFPEYRGTTKLRIQNPYSWKAEQIALSPTANGIQSVTGINVLTQLKGDIIGSHPLDWLQDAWPTTDRDRETGPGFFATTIRKGTTTGMMRNIALRMHSEWTCQNTWRIKDEYPNGCDGGVEFPYRHPSLSLNICLQGNGTGYVEGRYVSPWANTTDRQRITEEIFIRMPNIEIPDPYNVGDQNYTTNQISHWRWDHDFQCTVNTEMAYFVLGNDDNNQTYSPRISQLNDSDLQILGLTSHYARFQAYGSDYELYSDRGAVSYEPLSPDMVHPAGGPLMLTAQALFGNGSFFDLSQRVSADGPNHAEYSAMLAASCPYPFQRHPDLNYECESQSRIPTLVGTRDWNWAAKGVVEFISLLREQKHGAGTGLLDSALYMANRAVMQSAVKGTDDVQAELAKINPKRNAIFRVDGVAYRQFVMSTAAMVVISALLGIQVLGILALVCYTYLYPTWTSTLDALAIARIAQQLKDGHLLRSIGLRNPTAKEMKSLSEIDGLIGMVEPQEPIPLEDMSSTAATSTLRASGSAEHGNSGHSSVSHADAQSHHSQARVVPVVTDDPQMGMSSIPIDAQTVISEEDVGDSNITNNNNNNNNTTTPDTNTNTRTTARSHGLNPSLPPPPVEPSGPRLSFNIADMVPEHDQPDNHRDGPTSPPAYTPRTAEPPLGLMPPSYTSSLIVSELRVGAAGIVTRKNIPRIKDAVWV